ncbi:tRNA (uracil-5-)-methyltransferase homolog B [Sphaerodactylus townsendi]|uniref:tRNA (uracil-5-)-methyltransferase homolog B n=1 Tax=Sphaerodactylus townsendi TaxID=933632 RepID=UPI002026B103|nr:tRNA (uracil-5-)-methyltransferase homolog B [Sphaerodactylus townsendi]
MAAFYGQRFLSRLQACQPSCLRQAFLTSAPVDCKQVLGRNEPRKKRWKEKKLKDRWNSQDLNSSWEERLSSVATPLCGLPYEEQLKVKYEKLKSILQNLATHLKELGADRLKITQMPDGICCSLKPVIPSPIVNGYRNKSTFSVNHGPDRNPKTVGMYVGTGKGRNIVCVRTNHLLNMPQSHLQVAQYYEEFLRQSPLDPCLLFHMGGHWRELIVRTNRKGDKMAIITFHPQHLNPEDVSLQKGLVKDFFTRGPGAVCGLTSLYFQESTMTSCSHEQSPYQLLSGEPHIFEELLGLKFRISPDAFFQVNTAGAEVLYKTIGEMSRADKDTVLLDICCGTGAIGLSLADQVSRVIGVELVEQAIEDAKWNAAFNGISNCEFHNGKAEAVLPQLLMSWSETRPLTAVVNPSRAGLHYRVVRAIRNCEAIRRLVYVSCKPEGEAMRNFLEFCCPPDSGKKLRGEAFAPVLAVPVDLFPHTSHCELVLLLAR